MAVVACLGLACSGELSGSADPDSTSPGNGSLDPILPGTQGGPEQQAANAAVEEQQAVDAENQAQNPELYDIAQRYFPGAAPDPAEARLMRLTRTQLDRTAQIVLPGVGAPSALSTLPSDPLQTNYEYSDNLTFNAANFTPFNDWVAGLADLARTNPALVVDCASEGDAPACLTQQARAFVTRAFRGVADETLLTRYAEFFGQSVGEVGLAEATADLVAVTLGSPHFAFRDEVQTDTAGFLLPAQRLQAISYTLADVPPEALDLGAPANALANAEQVEATVQRLLDSEAGRDKLVRFFLAWLEVKEPTEFTIASSVFPEFTPELAQSIVAETRAFIAEQLQTSAPRLADLMEVSRAVVSAESSFLYGLDSASQGSAIELDPSQRFGLFTQPAVLASHSGPTNTRLVKRGVFFTRKVMCLPLGVPPAGLDTSIPEIDGASERQRIEAATQNSTCAACHTFINPFGFMLENYDAIGRYRTSDEQGLPIDASISVDFLDEGPLATDSPVAALQGFTRSHRFQQCFTRQLFRFYMGRNETAGDDPLLRQMFFEFANNQTQSIQGLLRTLVGSAHFSQRREIP
jgi:hypothetical protein